MSKHQQMEAPRFHWKDELGEQVHVLCPGEVVIGRRAGVGVLVNDPHVSRHHAKVTQTEQGYCLVDLKSTHGTYVNGRRIEQHLLQHGDRIILGRARAHLFYLTGHDADVTRLSGVTEEILPEKSLMELSLVVPSQSSDLEKISCLLDFHYQWGQVFTPEKAFEQILTSSLKISGAERGFILLKKPSGFGYAAGMDGQGHQLSQLEFQTSNSVVEQVTIEREPVFMVERIEGKFVQQESIVAMGLRAIACLPLFGLQAAGDSPTILGILYLDSHKAMHSLSGLDRKVLSKLAEEAGHVLEKVEMIKSFEERKTLEQELALAEDTQRNLLPQSLPQLHYLRLYAYSKPTRYVGGDFYSFLETDSGGLIGILGDVSGKGVSAALLSAMLLGCLEMQLQSGHSPEDALNHLNKFLCQKSSSGRFATIFLFAVNTGGTGAFISAGHNTAYLFRSATRELEELPSNNLIVGAFDFVSYQSSPLCMYDGDVLVVYSDGLTDAENPQGEMLGEERLKRVICEEARSGAEHLEQKLLETIQCFTLGWAQTDDITLTLMEKTSQ